MDVQKLQQLRQVINENLRVQRGGAKPVPYIDTTSALTDICARQNHVIFARRGCGKTLLLHDSAGKLPATIKSVYLNCEDFKAHSFPNVLIEVLSAVFTELQKNLTGWFGKQKQLKDIITKILGELEELKKKDDTREAKVREETGEQAETGVKLGAEAKPLNFSLSDVQQSKAAIEKEYTSHDNKLKDLNMWLPRLKGYIRDFFAATSKVNAVFVQVDDFYHLRRADQPHVMDYIHRLCKDVPLFFKVATLRHVSTLYADREGQPTGAQERHDYQPINIDFSFHDFRRTEQQIKKIFHEYGKQAGCSPGEIDGLFKGDGFTRLVLTGGGVPRDCLSLFLEALSRGTSEDGRIGKDDIRMLSAGNFERRIEELKNDCNERREQETLLRGIYALRQYITDKKINVFLIEERTMQENDDFRALIYRLLDYRIIHSVAAAFTHKNQKGTYHAYAIDAGCYGQLRKLAGKFNEIDLAVNDAKEKVRSAPVLSKEFVSNVWSTAPADVEKVLKAEVKAEA